MSVQLNLNSIDYSGSIVDGPGVRTVVFVQGCDQRCEDCHNPSTWDHKAGKLVEVKQIVEEIMDRGLNRKITISGGEPLLQYNAVFELVKRLEGFDIALYTGYDFEDVPKEILKYLHYIKFGKYIKEKRTTLESYIGSNNQKFIDLRGSQR